jgi:hypothetical protein
MRRSQLVIAAAVVGCAVGLNACGGTAEKKIASKLGEHGIAPKVAPPAATLISEHEIAALPQSSPRRALLSLWSSLQWEAWPDALSYYQAGLIKQVGVVALLQAWKFNAATYRTTKPKIEGETTQDGRITIHYLLSGSQIASTPSSIVWERVNSRWIVYYDSSLDNTLRGWAQAEAQQAINPKTTTLSPRAIAAGVHAGEIQGRYQKSQLDKNGG